MSTSTPDTEFLLQRFIAAAPTGPQSLRDLIAALSASARTPENWRDVAVGMIRAGFAEPAAFLLEAGMAQFPASVDLRYWRGNAWRLCARFDRAEVDYRDVLRTEAGHRDAALSLAFMLREQGRIQAAVDVIMASQRTRSADVAETKSSLSFLRECGAYVQAHELARTACARWPADADFAALAGEFALALGRFDEAQTDLRTALAANADKSASWLRLAYCHRFESSADGDIALMRSAYDRADLSAITHTCLGFALGKACDEIGEFESATSFLREANRAASATAKWDASAWSRFVDVRLSAIPVPKGNANEFDPVFVVGLPRTGTTLVATLLDREYGVRDRGELNWIDGMFRHLDRNGQLLDRSAIEATARLVEAQMRRDDAPARFYLDKNPQNFRYLDLIAAMFPRAKIIHCRRGARDTALSLWMQHFAHDDVGYSYDFAAIADFARGYRRLMEHWRKTLRVAVFDLDYEKLATDASRTMSSLAEFLGAAPRQDLGGPAASPTAIATASVWQARQPVNPRSIGRWRNYAPYIAELERLFEA
jgi:tetratricopeptide (TPR) repeat protein